jgi:hypothetical protein
MSERRDRHVTGPYTGGSIAFRGNDQRPEIDPDREGGHCGDDSRPFGPTSVRNPQPQKCDVSSHEGGKDFAKFEKADRIDSPRRECQPVKQQVSNPNIDRCDVERCDSRPIVTGFWCVLGISVIFGIHSFMIDMY